MLLIRINVQNDLYSYEDRNHCITSNTWLPYFLLVRALLRHHANNKPILKQTLCYRPFLNLIMMFESDEVLDSASVAAVMSENEDSKTH